MRASERKASWTWLLALFTGASFIEVVFWSQMQAFTPLYLPHLGIRDAEEIKTWTGAIVAISSIVGLPFLPFWGALADRYSRQPIIIRSFIAHLVAGIIALLAGNIWLFVAGRAVMSLSLGNSGLMLTTLSESTPPQRVGFAFSIVNGAGPLGAFLGPLIGGPIVDHWGFPALLIVDVVLMAVVILSLTFGYRDQFVGTNRGSLTQMAAASVGIIVHSPRLRTLFPALFLLFAGWMLAFTYLPLVVSELYQGPDKGTATGIVLGAGGLVTLILSPILGAAGDRWGHWRVLFLGALVETCLWPLPALTRDLTLFTIIWAAINGVGSAVFALSFSVLAQSAAPDVRGRVMTFAYLPVNLGSAFGPILGSLLTPLSIFAIFPAAAVLTACGIATLFLAQRQQVVPTAALLAEV